MLSSKPAEEVVPDLHAEASLVLSNREAGSTSRCSYNPRNRFVSTASAGRRHQLLVTSSALGQVSGICIVRPDLGAISTILGQAGLPFSCLVVVPTRVKGGIRRAMFRVGTSSQYGFRPDFCSRVKLIGVASTKITTDSLCGHLKCVEHL